MLLKLLQCIDGVFISDEVFLNAFYGRPLVFIVAIYICRYKFLHGSGTYCLGRVELP